MNFHEMKNFVDNLNLNGTLLESLRTGFVDGYSSIEMAEISENLTRLHKSVLDMIPTEAGGNSEDYSSFHSLPAQIISLASGETSLRLTRPGDDDSYLYGNIEIETREWERITKGIILGPEVKGLILKDFNIVKHLNSNEKMIRNRIAILYKLTQVFYGSWLAFVHKKWITDLSTGSFDGRNFSSGPRDSNQWGIKGSKVRDGLVKDLDSIQRVLSLFGEIVQAFHFQQRDSHLSYDLTPHLQINKKIFEPVGDVIKNVRQQILELNSSQSVLDSYPEIVYKEIKNSSLPQEYKNMVELFRKN